MSAVDIEQCRRKYKLPHPLAVCRQEFAFAISVAAFIWRLYIFDFNNIRIVVSLWLNRAKDTVFC